MASDNECNGEQSIDRYDEFGIADLIAISFPIGMTILNRIRQFTKLVTTSIINFGNNFIPLEDLSYAQGVIYEDFNPIRVVDPPPPYEHPPYYDEILRLYSRQGDQETTIESIAFRTLGSRTTHANMSLIRTVPILPGEQPPSYDSLYPPKEA